MLDDDKKDFGPFDDEYLDDDFDDDFDKKPKDIKETKKSDKGDFDQFPEAETPNFEDDEDLPDDVPAVSKEQKKNIAAIMVVSFFVLFVVYQFTSSGDEEVKPVAKNETEEMSEEFRERGSVPTLDRDYSKLADEAAKKKRQEQSKLENIVVAPPPPPLIEASSQFVGGSSSGPAGLPSLGRPPSISSSNSPREPLVTKLFANNGRSGGSGPGLPSLGSGGSSGSYNGARGGQGGANVIVSEDYRERIQAPMFLLRGSDTDYVNKRESISQGLPDRNYVMALSGADRSDATYIGDLNSVIIQGKVIDAVIETAINTDLPDGILRGIISRDVYAEKGNRVLIPKGSRLIGKYNTEVKFGQARVFIIWDRVIRPDGVDAILDSQATDLLGRNGVYGKLDNRFFEIFGSSILLSSISVAFAIAASSVAGDTESSQSSSVGGNVVENTNPETEAIKAAVENVGGKVSEIAEELLINKPRVLVNQGTKIKVFVNKDVHFPDEFVSDGNKVNIIY